MTDGERDPTRWKEQPGSSSDPEQMLGALVRGMGGAPQLSERQLSRIASSLHSRPDRRRVLRLWPAVLMLLLGSSVVMAAQQGWIPGWPWKGPPVPAPSPPPAKKLATARVSSSRLPGPPPPSLPQPRPEADTQPKLPPVLAALPGADRKTSPANHPGTTADERHAHAPAIAAPKPFPRGTHALTAWPTPTSGMPGAPPTTETTANLFKEGQTAPVERPAPAPPVGQPAAPTWGRATLPVSPIPPAPVLETTGRKTTITPVVARPPDGSRWLADAIRSLRKEHAPAAALAILDAHAQELAQEGMSQEGTLVRVEAMLALHRAAEALRLLDATPLSDVTARGLLLTRAELRAREGRFSDGLGDFDLVLARLRRPDERALYGRALCRLHTGDRPGATRDFQQYEQLFPQGPHIEEVRKHLGGR